MRRCLPALLLLLCLAGCGPAPAAQTDLSLEKIASRLEDSQTLRPEEPARNGL